jgi:hypothetical protein
MQNSRKEIFESEQTEQRLHGFIPCSHSRRQPLIKKRLVFLLVFLIPLIVNPIPAAGDIIYVDDDAAGFHDGSGWQHAFGYLQDALAAAAYGDEIRVAQGVYTPDKSSAFPDGTGDIHASFQLVSGTVLIGGYAGVTGVDPNARDVDQFETVLSGDLTGSETSLHVVVCNDVGPATIVNGFTITGGNAAASSGGGLMSIDSSLTLIDCRFIANSAEDSGGGIYHYGEMLIEEEVVLKLRRCIFLDNSGFFGGAMVVMAAHVELVDCHFMNNAAEYGPAVAQDHAKTTLTNCSLIGNTGATGAIQGNSVCLMKNCTIAGNTGGVELFHGVLTIENSIIWGNTDFQIYEDPEFPPQITVAYSTVEGGWPGNGNLDTDPLFAGLYNGDAHLMSAYGRWSGQQWVYDAVTSPCIDAGNPADPNWTEELWPHGKRINMGAYGGTTQASKSSNTAGSIADFNHDDCVDTEDLLRFVGQWLTMQVLCPQDMDLDGQVDLHDFTIFAENWAFCP